MTQLLKDFLSQDKNFRKLNAVLLWDDIVDKKILKHTKALKLQRNVLYVLTESPVWAHELGFFKKELIDKLNDKAGEDLVKDIRFKVGGMN